MSKDLSQLIGYIEKHLTEGLTYKKIVENTGISEYQLKRIFTFIAGMFPMDYIKNHRLALVSRDLLGGEKVTEAAFRYGYEAVEGFSRAFRDWSGYLLSEISRYGIQKSFPHLTFFIDARGRKSTGSRIEKKEQFCVVGVAKKVPVQSEGVNQEIQKLVQMITETQREEMHRLGDLYPHQVINVSYGFDGDRLKEKGSLMHMIGFAITKENPYIDLEMLAIEEHTWVIFPNKGSFLQTLQDTWGKIYAEWLSSPDYELVEALEISSIKRGEDLSHAYSEIWTAAKAKK